MNTDSESNVSRDPRECKRKLTYEDDNSHEGPRLLKKMKRENLPSTDNEDWSPSRDEDEEVEENEVKPRVAEKKKKRKYLQRYSAKFENNPLFRGWVKASSKGNHYAYCIPCGAHLKITSGKTDLQKHSNMRKHKMNVEGSHRGENQITAFILGDDQPIASVDLPVHGKDSKSSRKKKYYQRYSHSYEEDPEFVGWVTASPKGEYFAHCIPCDVELSISGGKADLKRHAKNKKHIAAKAELDNRPLVSNSKSSDQSITAYIPKEECCEVTVHRTMKAVQISASMRELEDLQKSPVTLEVSPFSRTVYRPSDKDSNLPHSRLNETEVQIAAFIAEHDLPVATSDHLIQLIKTLSPYPIVAQNLESGGTDMVMVINNVLGKEGCDELIQLLKTNKFSLIVDKATDRGSEKHLSMVVRVLHNFSVSEAFLNLIPMNDATAESLYNDVVDFFSRNEIPYQKNMLGIAADGGNPLLGGQYSLLSLMKQDIPELFVMNCISHSFSLCASAACLKLPRSLEDLARDVYSYFHYSSNHTQLEEFKDFTQVKPHKLLHPAQTRWLSLHAVVSKILEKYDSLKSYFTNAVLVDKLEAPETILQRLRMPVTKLYLMFLDFILPIFDNLDKQMQSESSQIHVLNNAVGVALKAIFECYLEDSYIRTVSLKDIDYKDEAKFKPMEEMYLGIKVQLEISSSPHLQHEDLKDFQINCLEFLIESVSQIYKRFSHGSPIFEALENLNPKIVIDRNVPSLISLIYYFEHLATPDIQVVDSEWRVLRNMLETLPVESSMRPEVFWDIVSKARHIDNILMCPNLSEFMLKLLCLPNCTAAVENIFSNINKMKRKSKNLSTDTLMGLLYTKQIVKRKFC